MSNEITEFVKAALRNPMAVSTVFPATRYLAKSMIKHSCHSPKTHTLEIGCGSGAITKYILETPSSEGGSYRGVEMDAKLVHFLENTYPGFDFIACSAADMKDHIEDASMDCIISSLPWSLFGESLQSSIINEFHRVLKPGGCFVTYMYVSGLIVKNSRRALDLFRENFSSVENRELIYRNIPPAYVFRATK